MDASKYAIADNSIAVPPSLTRHEATTAPPAAGQVKSRALGFLATLTRRGNSSSVARPYTIR